MNNILMADDHKARVAAVRGFLLGTAAFVIGALVLPAAVTAATIYTLTEDGSTGGFGAGPYGTVTVEQLNATDLHIVLDVTPNFSIDRGGHFALTFSLSESNALINIDNSSTPHDYISLGNGTYNNAPWNGFNYAIACSKTNGDPATSGNCGQVLDFTVTGAGSLLANTGGNGVFFAADLFAVNTGQTGAAGALVGIDDDEPPVIPIPAAAWLFGSALLGLGAIGRRKKAGINRKQA